MKSSIALILILLIAANGFAQQKESPNQATRIAGTRVSLKPPSGFTPSEQFPGYWLESLGSSIVVTEIPGPILEVSSGFSKPSELMKRSMSLLNKQDVTINGQSGILVQVTQSAYGTDYLKWIVILGDEKECVVIVATFPKQHENELSQKMRTSILTASWDRERKVSPTEGLNFTINEMGGLKLANRITNALLFTKSGISPSKAIDDPLFVIAQSISQIEVDDLEEFAQARISQTESVTDIQIEQSNKVSIDNLPGYEILAKGEDVKSGEPMVIYQIMLFEAQGFYIMQGLVSDKQRQLYLTVFKEMARSFKRKS